MNRSPRISFDQDLPQIDVWLNQTFTVWLRANRVNDWNGAAEGVQVELRVLMDGTLQIFTDLNKIELKTHDDWYPSDQEPS